MSPIFDLQLDQGEKGPSGDVQSQEEMGVGEAIAIHSKLSTAIRCEHFWGGQEVVGLGRLLTDQHSDTACGTQQAFFCPSTALHPCSEWPQVPVCGELLLRTQP